jgi:L-fuconolactonase
LAEFKDHPKFVGVRHVVQDEPDPDFMVRPEILRGLKVLEKHGVPYDLLFYVQHIKHAETVARHCPNLPLVIDHLSKPRIREQVVGDWESHFRAAARYPNVSCKISGMITEADWTGWKPADLKPYVDIALDCFGPERLMFGSDWPVCELAGSYERVYAATQELIGRLSPSEQGEINGGTAKKFYGLRLE